MCQDFNYSAIANLSLQKSGMLIVLIRRAGNVTILEKITYRKPLYFAVGGVVLLVILAALYLQTRPERHAVPAEITTVEKKVRFQKIMLPAVRKVHAELESAFLKAEKAVAAGTDLAAKREEYRAVTDSDLLGALKPHPISIVLAQAAMESAWGTSRFFVEANNVFGVWSFDPDEPRIAAQQKRGDTTVYVKRYKTLQASIRDYYRTLARGEKFAEFRSLRLTSDDPFKLVTKLDSYSEKGAVYGEELSAIIRRNEFQQYD
jgi:Bax protein